MNLFKYGETQIEKKESNKKQIPRMLQQEINLKLVCTFYCSIFILSHTNK